MDSGIAAGAIAAKGITVGAIAPGGLPTTGRSLATGKHNHIAGRSLMHRALIRSSLTRLPLARSSLGRQFCTRLSQARPCLAAWNCPDTVGHPQGGEKAFDIIDAELAANPQPSRCVITDHQLAPVVLIEHGSHARKRLSLKAKPPVLLPNTSPGQALGNFLLRKRPDSHRASVNTQLATRRNYCFIHGPGPSLRRPKAGDLN